MRCATQKRCIKKKALDTEGAIPKTLGHPKSAALPKKRWDAQKALRYPRSAAPANKLRHPNCEMAFRDGAF